MVKQINIFLDDSVHAEVLKAKGDMTWINFFIILGEISKDESLKPLIEKKLAELKKNG
jgi:hypothetical protein